MPARPDSTRQPAADSLRRRLVRGAGRLLYRAPRELRQCPACGSPRLDALTTQRLPAPIDGRRTALVSGCEECGLVFVNPLPSDAELTAMYGPQGEWAGGRLDEAEPSASEHARGRGTWPRIFDPVRDTLDVTQPPPGARVLDFGCGRGKFLDVLQLCGWDTCGIEPAMEVAFERHRRLEAIPTEPTFDLIIANHVLEHVTDPLRLLRSFAAAARPGAALLIGVPRLDTLPIHRDRSYVISRVHVTAYTAPCLLTLLQRSGWEAAEAPRDEIAISGGRRTAARLRVVARRVGEPTAPSPVHPLDAARRALAEYAAQQRHRPLTGRLGGARLTARAIELKRQLRGWARRLGVLRDRASPAR